MWLLVGLGNPGSQYKFNRHNIGFMAVDSFVGPEKLKSFRSEFKAEFQKLKYKDEEIVLLKPQTYMNLSGDSVQEVVNFFKIPLDKIIVIHDEIDQPFGKIKVQKARGHGGHNGVRDITAKLGTNDYIRLRLGVGRPTNPNINVADHVLQNFAKEEQAGLEDLLIQSTLALESIIIDGYAKAANKYN
jgi:peptidyl-tRNA hydrolase, PTH1 family